VRTIGAPASTEHLLHLLHLLDESRQELEETGEAEICLAARPFRIRRQFLEDISDQPQADRIRRLGAALLVMHSPSRNVGVHGQQVHKRLRGAPRPAERRGRTDKAEVESADQVLTVHPELLVRDSGHRC